MKFKLLFVFIVLSLFITFVNSELGYNNPKLPKLTEDYIKSEVNINNINTTLNGSYWTTSTSQGGLTGYKSGGYNINTTGSINANEVQFNTLNVTGGKFKNNLTLNEKGDFYLNDNRFTISHSGSPPSTTGNVYGNSVISTLDGNYSTGYNTYNYIVAKGLYSSAFAIYNFVTAQNNNTQALTGIYTSVNPQYSNQYTMGLYLLSSSTIAHNPNTDQIGLKINWRNAGADNSKRRWAIFNAGTNINASKIFLGKDNVKTYFGTGYDASISYDGTNMVFITNETGTGVAWFSKNISATGYLTRTSVYDKSKGSALSKIKDSSQLIDSKGKIKHDEFYGYTKTKVTDLSRPEIRKEIIIEDVIDNKTGKQIKKIIEINQTYYPYYKYEDGVNIVDEIELLRQGIYELKTELCLKDKTYGWC